MGCRSILNTSTHSNSSSSSSTSSRKMRYPSDSSIPKPKERLYQWSPWILGNHQPLEIQICSLSQRSFNLYNTKIPRLIVTTSSTNIDLTTLSLKVPRLISIWDRRSTKSMAEQHLEQLRSNSNSHLRGRLTALLINSTCIIRINSINLSKQLPRNLYLVPSRSLQ